MIVSLLLPLAGWADEIKIRAMNWVEKPKAGLQLDLTDTSQYQLVQQAGLIRLEIHQTSPKINLIQPPPNHSAVSHIASMPGKSGKALVLLMEVKTSLKPLVFQEDIEGGSRLVLQWNADAAPLSDSQAGTTGVFEKSVKPEENKRAYSDGHAPFVIVVDAGHGGKDNGAVGPSGLTEKEVTLALAKRLGKKIRGEPGMRLVMIRADDQFVDLSHRADIARHANADLFVSLHANAHDSNGISGSSVYILSDSRASTEAAHWLSERENAALIGGVELADKNPELATVLLDLSKIATLKSSEMAAMHVLKALGRDFPVHSKEVQKAGFAVLKSIDVPSLLIETAFITNPDEERELRNPKFLDRMAETIFRGIKNYIADRGQKKNISE